MQHTDSPAAMKFAEEKGIYAFGQASDMASFGPNAQLTAIVDNWNPYYLARVKAVLDGTWKTGDTWDGIKEGTVVLSPWSKKLPDDVVKLAEAARDGIASGAVHPFTGPHQQAGRQPLAEGRREGLRQGPLQHELLRPGRRRLAAEVSTTLRRARRGFPSPSVMRGSGSHRQSPTGMTKWRIHLPTTILRGQTLAFRDDPFKVAPDAAVDFHADGAVAIAGGKILEVGEAAAVIARHPGAEVETYARHLIMAGFVDSHVHYPQIDIIASYGEQLLAWLEKYTFPAEARFGDRGHADQAANRFLDECLRNGITTASVYCTVHPASVDAFCTAAQQRGFCMAAGKVMMDRNARDDLQDTAQAGYDQSKALIARWHGVDRLTYVVTPRFAVTSSPAQLEAAGTLWREHPTDFDADALEREPGRDRLGQGAAPRTARLPWNL